MLILKFVKILTFISKTFLKNILKYLVYFPDGVVDLFFKNTSLCQQYLEFLELVVFQIVLFSSIFLKNPRNIRLLKFDLCKYLNSTAGRHCGAVTGSLPCMQRSRGLSRAGLEFSEKRFLLETC